MCIVVLAKMAECLARVEIMEDEDIFRNVEVYNSLAIS